MDRNEAITQLRRRIRTAAAAWPTDALLRAMGYRGITTARRARLHNVLADDLLGMENGGFDFRYDASSFVAALCEALGFKVADYETGLVALELTAENRRAFAPFIRIDTDFRRANQPIFVLALRERFRRIDLPPAFRDLPAVAQIHQAGQTVAGHFKEHNGELEFWGRITGYRFFYEPEKRVVFDTAGNVETLGPCGHEDAPGPNASLSLDGRVLDSVLR